MKLLVLNVENRIKLYRTETVPNRQAIPVSLNRKIRMEGDGLYMDKTPLALNEQCNLCSSYLININSSINVILKKTLAIRMD